MVGAALVGCYVGRDDPRLWSVEGGVKGCISRCARQDRPYSAVWKNYCACANDLGGLKKTKGDCTFKCKDDSSMLCGGPNNRISIYDASAGLGSGLPGYAWWLIGFGCLILIVIILAIIKAVCQKAKMNRSDTYARDMEADDRENHKTGYPVNNTTDMLEENQDVTFMKRDNLLDKNPDVTFSLEEEADEDQCGCSCHDDQDNTSCQCESETAVKHPESPYTPLMHERPPPINPQHSVEMVAPQSGS